MKIDRLIGILSILLQQEKVTAPYLAEKFEVSRRTINRDIEDICKAGIPLVTVRGRNGGISIMEGYRINRKLLTSSDMQSILAGLRSLDSVSGTNKYQQLMEKLAVGASAVLKSNDHIVIDLSSWSKSALAPKIELIQAAIERKEIIAFCYYGPRGEGERSMEPYVLVFKWASWYVWGFCSKRRSYRMFKLKRMLNVKNTGECFAPREVPVLDIDQDKIFKANLKAVILFEKSEKWRLIEEYGAESFQEQEDGRLLFQGTFESRDTLFQWLLAFGPQAKLLKPERLQEEFLDLLAKMKQNYI